MSAAINGPTLRQTVGGEVRCTIDEAREVPVMRSINKIMVV